MARTNKEKAKIAPRAAYPMPDGKITLVSLMQARRAWQINDALSPILTPQGAYLDFQIEGTLLAVCTRHAPKGWNFRATIEGASGWVLWCGEFGGFTSPPVHAFTEVAPIASWEDPACPMEHPHIPEQEALHQAWMIEV